MAWILFYTRKWNSMVKMVNVFTFMFFKFFIAVVTPIMLSFQLCSNFQSGKRSFNVPLTHTPFLPSDPSPCKVTPSMKLVVTTSLPVNFVSMKSAMASLFFNCLFSMFPIVASVIFYMCMVVNATIVTVTFYTSSVQSSTTEIFRILFKVFDCSREDFFTFCTTSKSFWNICNLCKALTHAFLTLTFKPANPRPFSATNLEEIRCSRENLKAFSATLAVFWNSINLSRTFGWFSSSSTLSANVIQTVFVTFFFAEKILCGRQNSLTSRTLLVWGIVLGYITHTAEPPILLSRLWQFAPAQGQNHIKLPHHYTSKQPLKQLWGVL